MLIASTESLSASKSIEETLMHQYLKSSPECVELVRIWDRIEGVGTWTV